MAKFVFDDGTEFEFEKDDAPTLGGIIAIYGAVLRALSTGDSSNLVKMVIQVEMANSANTAHLIKFGEQLLLKEVSIRTGKTEDEIREMTAEHYREEKSGNASEIRKMFE